jgi:hypothetical protein
MRRTKLTSLVLAASIGLAPLAGCENLPGNKKEQGAVIGGVGGAVAGAGGRERKSWARGAHRRRAGRGRRVPRRRQVGQGRQGQEQDQGRCDQGFEERPEESRHRSRREGFQHRDLNDDGFVTLDEVVAMKDAGLSDKEMIKRLQRTQQYFELSDEQVKYLRDHNVDDKVVTAMRDMRPDEARTASEKTAPSRQLQVDMRTNPR